MNDQDWGLSEKGFRRPNYTELLNATEYKARELFGEGINLTIRSPLGILLRILAWIWSILFAVLEDVYNSRYADTAIGNSLINLGRNIGMEVLSANKATGHITITGTPGITVPAGYLVATPGGLQYVVSASAVIGNAGEVLATIQAVDFGDEYNTDANTVNVIVNPSAVKGIVSVRNQSPITGGRWRETDPEFRDRYYKSVDYAGGANADAIRAALLNDVDGVTVAQVYENDQDDLDPYYHLPPHSIEAVVYGGLDEDVAKAIFKKKAGGIQTAGNMSVNIVSASEQIQTIYFSRPESRMIYVKIADMRTDTSFLGNESIVTALITHIGNARYSGLGVGADVVYMQILTIVASVRGVIDFDMEIGIDGIDYGKSNIPIGYREMPAVNTETVVIL